MLAPTDKRNDTIQILVTRKCDLFYCSNCTQLLPFRKDAIEMSVDVFREALRSLEGWYGIRAMFGGNPTTHSRFPDLCQIMIEEVPDQSQRGIWTNSLGKHGQIVRDTFYPDGRFNCNAHADIEAADEMEKWLPGKLIQSSRDRASWHSAILMDYRDFGISEPDWIEMREGCDINQRWSAAIAERDGRPYAYFCEVGAALDGMRGENNGILAEPGWWAWGIEKFQNQVHKCCDTGCGVPLKLQGHLDRDDTYDYSKSHSKLVELTINSKKHAKGKLHNELPERTEMATDYQAIWTTKKEIELD